MEKKIYPYRVKEGAAEIMAKIVKYHAGLDRRMNGKVCRITVTSYPIIENIKPEFLNQYANDRIYQIKLKGVKEPEYLVMESMLERMDEEEVDNE